MKVLVVGNGGREYSILKKLSEDGVELLKLRETVEQVYLLKI